jgi:hypothetical protein
VLRRPVQTTRVTGQVGSGTNISAAEDSMGETLAKLPLITTNRKVRHSAGFSYF